MSDQVTLRDYFDARIDGMAENDRAYRRVLEARVELLNNGHERTIGDLGRRLEVHQVAIERIVPREEIEVWQRSSLEDRRRLHDELASRATHIDLAAVADKVDAMQSEIDRSEGRRTIFTVLAAAASAAVASIVAGLVVYVLTHH